jgi:molecular chaperone GrpE
MMERGQEPSAADVAAAPPSEGAGVVQDHLRAQAARQEAGQQARIDELSRAYAALLEDHEAFRQRLERDRVRQGEAERARVLLALLETADDLERVPEVSIAAGAQRQPAHSQIVQGVRLSLASLHKRIAALGAERLVLEGQPFDPTLAEAVEAVPVADVELDGLVLEVVRPGYRLGSRLLRPATVRVGRLVQA